MWATNEQAIITRLRSRLAADVHVGPSRDLEASRELRQKAPAVWVVYDGYRPGDSNTNVPHVQQIVQEWWVVVTTKSARGNGAVDEARDAACALCDQVLDALLGFHVGGGKYLHLSDAPGPEYDAGYCIVPLSFTCAATFRGTP